MTPKQVLKYYGTAQIFANSTSFTKEALYKWLKQGYIPAKSQIEIQEIVGSQMMPGRPYEAKEK